MIFHDKSNPANSSPDKFVSTQWSIVLQAGKKEGKEALTLLCRRYWFPLYAYVRRRVKDVNEAEDLTQEFFANLLEKNILAKAIPERGRFRSFLLTSLKNFLANQWDRKKAQKRGGGLKRLAFDLKEGESRLNLEPASNLTPERMFERHWTLMLLELVLKSLEQEFKAAGKTQQFELLKPTLTGEGTSPPYRQVAEELGMTEEAVRKAASRLRRRYRDLLREEILQTLADPADVDQEINLLFETFGG